MNAMRDPDFPALPAPSPFVRARLRADQAFVPLVCLGLGFVALSLILGNAHVALVSLLLGASCLASALVGRAASHRLIRAQRRLARMLGEIADHDPQICFATTGDGTIFYANNQTRELFGTLADGGVVGILGRYFASPAAVLYRMQSQALSQGGAEEDVATSDGGGLRLRAHALAGHGCFWRIEALAETAPAHAPAHGDLASVTISRMGHVLHLSTTMQSLLGAREMRIDRIIADLPVRSGQVHDVVTLAGLRRLRVVEVAGLGGRTTLYFLPADEVTRDGGWQVEDSFPVPMLKLNPGGRVLRANRLARDLLAYEGTGEFHLGDLVEGLGRPLGDWLQDTFAGRRVKRTEILRAKRRDRELFLQVTLGKINDGGEPRLIAVLHDATDLKSLEAQFVQSQKMQAIGQLAGGVAHDFNNLLTAISGHCDLLLLRHDKNDPEFGDLTQISQNANRAASLVGQLLAFSRKQTLQPEVLNLRQAISEHTHLLARLVGEKIRLDVQQDADVPPIRADRRQFEQVMMNLVVNARDAMKATGGTIRVITSVRHLRVDLRRDRVTVPAGEYVQIRVEDSGIGIPEDQLDKIFEPFFTTKKAGEGTGLGLSTVYGIVKQSGGYVFVDSVVGQGTEFTLLFPAHHAVAVEPVVVPMQKPQPRPQVVQGGTVLLVEDEAPVRAFAARALRMRGFTVHEADCAESALEILADPAFQCDIFVTDVIMPGMDGPTWVSQALVDRPKVRVVFVSGYSEDSVAEHRNRIPNSVFLPKPFSLSQLTATVQDQMRPAEVA